MAKTAAGLLTQLREDLKEQQERQRQDRNILRSDIARAGLTNGMFLIPDSAVKALATDGARLRKNYSDTDRDNDRLLFDPEILELDGWTKSPAGLYRGLNACPSADMPANDPSVTEFAAGDEAARQWLVYLTAMADPRGWQARQDRRTWLLHGRLGNFLRDPKFLKDLLKLAGEKNRALFEEPAVNDDGWWIGR